MDEIFGFRRPRYRNNTEALPINETPLPSSLYFPLISCGGKLCDLNVKEGDEVRPGQFLAKDGDELALVCPVKGKVVRIESTPDIRGVKNNYSVVVETAPDTSPEAFPPLDYNKESKETLWSRIEEAGAVTDSPHPSRLSEMLGAAVETLVVSAADREPLVCSAIQLFRERNQDVAEACKLLAKLTDAKKVLLAVSSEIVDEAAEVCRQAGIEQLSIGGYYPETLEPMIALKAGGSKVKVVAVETALSALDSVREGKVQDKKVVTVIDATGKAKANYRVQIGTALKELLAEAKVEPGNEDKVIAGGPLCGFAQYSLDAAVDAGVDAVMIIPASEIIKWTNEPCITCGSCISVCPTKLQPHMIGRYSEYGFFEKTEDYSLFKCIECGLCAMVCPAHRPLLQWIRLAKREVIKCRELEKQRQKQENSESAQQPTDS